MSQPTPTSPAKTPPTPRPRGRRKVEIGTVSSDKMDKTRRVEVSRLAPHPKYGKYLKQRTICYVHDEQNETRLGDLVEIMECRPLSKLKRWRLVRIVRKAPSHDDPVTRRSADQATPDAAPSGEASASETQDQGSAEA